MTQRNVTTLDAVVSAHDDRAERGAAHAIFTFMAKS